MVENEHFLALWQMGTKKAKMAMEEVNENKDGISESTSTAPVRCHRLKWVARCTTIWHQSQTQ